MYRRYFTMVIKPIAFVPVDSAWTDEKVVYSNQMKILIDHSDAHVRKPFASFESMMREVVDYSEDSHQEVVETKGLICVVQDSDGSIRQYVDMHKHGYVYGKIVESMPEAILANLTVERLSAWKREGRLLCAVRYNRTAGKLEVLHTIENSRLIRDEVARKVCRMIYEYA
jgi:hypothetical protein